MLCCLKLTFEALSIVLISVILHNKNQTFTESYGYILDLFSAFQFHASLLSIFFILSTLLFSRPVCEFGIALDMLQVVRYILGSGCKVGWIDRGCKKQSARTIDSEVLKRSIQQSTCPS